MCGVFNLIESQRFHSRGRCLCKYIGTKESVFIRKEFNSQRIGLAHQHGRRIIVLENQYGRRDVMWKHCILCKMSEMERLIPQLWSKERKNVYSIQVGTFDNKNPEVDTL